MGTYKELVINYNIFGALKVYPIYEVVLVYIEVCCIGILGMAPARVWAPARAQGPAEVALWAHAEGSR